ncbi:MAG: NAD(P)H-dependent oxidoreductase [Saprospiraceae bacterium]|nr:NAD(P)H-dependent oxidoreductase [Saprospiraceae bacterium]MBK8632932.1 NAD(P)H-dependent oxidoreductase [Saprospiraceae bacterium]MBP7642286.1 NAD(P)H-dependent oxidoreductase [Saprospiraceae bacterium]HOY14260.1 NAD(P)H-dependent oxidoreductase [Saprospiraceae bacterium]HPN69871.1 NAD(P)H-dependent oxidoreductase [Saprospiraceae bacterium]
MILVISGTNRPGSRTKLVADACYDYLSEVYQGEVRFLTMEDLPDETLGKHMYDKHKMPADLVRIQDELVIPAESWLIISPEYNGSFPGVLKLFVDAISVRRYKETFAGRRAGLIGVASGRAGNLRGLEHLTGFLNYLEVTVFPNKLPVSSIESQIVDGNLKEEAKQTLHNFLNAYLAWHN